MREWFDPTHRFKNTVCKSRHRFRCVLNALSRGRPASRRARTAARGGLQHAPAHCAVIDDRDARPFSPSSPAALSHVPLGAGDQAGAGTLIRPGPHRTITPAANFGGSKLARICIVCKPELMRRAAHRDEPRCRGSPSDVFFLNLFASAMTPARHFAAGRVASLTEGRIGYANGHAGAEG